MLYALNMTIIYQTAKKLKKNYKRPSMDFIKHTKITYQKVCAELAIEVLSKKEID